MPAIDVIPVGSKFAVLGMHTTIVDGELPDLTMLDGSLGVSRSVPVTAPEEWNRLLGMMGERFDTSDLFIIAHAPAEHPDMVDGENRRLSAQVHRLYWSLLLAVPFVAHEQALLVTGTRFADRFEMRSATEYPALPWVAWAPQHGYFDTTTLAAAWILYGQLDAFTGATTYPRLGRGNVAFYDAIRSAPLGERTLHFVRTTETLVFPPVGQARDAFVQRGRLFVGAGQDEALRQMYDIRSAVVHLHEPTRQLPSIGARGRGLLFLQRCFQAEALARFCLAHVASRTQLHAYLQDNQTLEVFWNLDPAVRQTAWGPTMDLGAVLDGFRGDLVDDDTLGLVAE